MTNRQNNWTFFMTSILLTGLLAIVAAPDASAHQDTTGCNSSAAGSGLTVFFMGNPVTSVIQTQAVTSSQDLQPLTDTSMLKRCAFDGQTDPTGFVGRIVITNPDGSALTVNTGDIPCIDGTTDTGNLMNPKNCAAALQTFTSNARAYTVDCADDGKNGDNVDGYLRWTATFYGRSHFTSLDTTPLMKEDTVDLKCKYPKWTAKTDSSEKSKTLKSPVSNPTDTISIAITNPVAGTFTATYSIPNSIGTAVTGTCTGGIVNVTAGTASLLCSATGTFGTTVANTCWDVKVTAPAGYLPAGEQTFLGKDDAANECFKVVHVGEGCTPGYWRNNLAKNIVGNDQSLTNWVLPHHDTFGATFGVAGITVQDNYKESKHKGQGKNDASPNAILAETIHAQGGDVNALARHATAALLNSANGNVNYSLTTAEILKLVQDALAPNGDIQGAKNILAGFNEDGCPIDQQPRVVP